MLHLISFLKELENLQSDFSDKEYLLAISGGADSMTLLDLFNKSKLSFQVAHVNYKLRGEDSDSDQKLVENFCSEREIVFHTYIVSEKDLKPKSSIQTWARKLRYDFFKKIQQQENLEFLVTAHHLNDDLETFIINLSRGSGSTGLSGIPAKKNRILRPLLKYSKEEIYTYCEKNTVSFREDQSNKKNDYLRNKIRNEIVPQLMETNNQFLNNFKNSLNYLKQNKTFVDKQIAIIEDQLTINENKGQKVFDKEHLEKQGAFVQFEILRKFGFNEPDEISKIFFAETGKMFYSKIYQLLINRNELILKKNTLENEDVKEILLISTLNFEGNKIINLREEFIENAESGEMFNSIDKKQSLISWDFDCQSLIFPLKMRHKKEGDIFHPIAMTGRKKVSKYFKDEKISEFIKNEIWLLVDGNDDILGVIPSRQDRRFAADKKTIQTLKLVF